MFLIVENIMSFGTMIDVTQFDFICYFRMFAPALFCGEETESFFKQDHILDLFLLMLNAD